MESPSSESVQEYHQVLTGVGCHEGSVTVFKQDGSSALVTDSGMVASLTVVADDQSITGDVTNEIIITADESLTISSDGNITQMKTVDGGSASDTLQSNTADKALGSQIVFIHQDRQLEQTQPIHSQSHQHVTQTPRHQILTVQQSQQVQHTPQQQQVLSVSSSQQHQRPHTQGGEIPIRPLISDIVNSNVLTSTTTSSPLSVSLSNTVSNGTVRLNSLPANLLANPTTVTTTVEQPNNGPCMCFVCGRQLCDPSERFYYLKTQKLFNTQVTLLELLSDVLNQTVVTNTGAVDLCSRCSELVNETDSAYTHLNRLKKQINGLFTNNMRPKLTFQVLPKTSNLGALGTGTVPRLYQPPQLNLDDLAATRPRRGRQARKEKKEENAVEVKVSTAPKKKGGRPRKPFGCHICKRKFLTKDMVASHMVKEHDIHPVGLAKPILGTSDSPEPGSGQQEEKKVSGNTEGQQVKQEQEDTKEKPALLPLKSSPMKDEGLALNTLNSLAPVTSTGRSILPSLTPIAPKVRTDAASQFLASMRPIQPKPQTMIQTAPDGSMVLFMNPTVVDSSPTVIKVTPGKDEETKDYLCSECGYMASTKKAFTDHQRIHSDDPGPKARCTICEKEMLASSYKIHMLRMHGEAKHPCDTCGQRFTVRSDLMRHINTIHSTLRPYDCDFCGEKFVTSDALRYHRNKTHSTVLHSCEYCGRNYKWKGELRTHVQRHHIEHKERFQCSLCSRNYADRRKLRHHMMTKHNVPREMTYFKNYQRDKNMITYKDGDDQIPNSGYEPQGTLLPPSVPSTPQASTHHVQPVSQAVSQEPIQTQPSIQHHISNNQNVYIVPDLGVPLHEEQVTTT
ncbi:hypothetical protein C7M84_001631 [Penaeus vannamei]|uniref:C2H2-type domain-containing protein n=1 Tax=Penaeus vannamei TaxID=6689 RepID=A0A423TT94_PENVA|nr:hypothetical protein C7M84_001631 [Penaeus vannamei]